MATVVFSKGKTAASIPTAQSYVTIYQSYLIAGLTQLRKDCEDLAAYQGVDIKDLVIPAGLLLGDMAELIQLDELQKVDTLGVGLATWLHQVSGVEHEAE